ncbi:MAG: hypothetical protein FWD94_03790 [Treponema sp.]|nr:hypothetical protein [Treponema sp.]
MKKLVIAIVLLACFAASVFSQQAKLGKLGVLPFTGGTAREGDLIAEFFLEQNNLRNLYTEVGTRTMALNTIFEELNIQRFSDLTNPDTMASIGKLLSADYALSGTITKLGDRNLLIVWIVDTTYFVQTAGHYVTYDNIEEIRGLVPSISAGLVSSASRQRAADLPALAVFPFNNEDTEISAQAAETLAQILSIEMLKSGNYNVVARLSIMQTALREQGFQMDMNTDKESRTTLGKALNAKLALGGNITGLGSDKYIWAQILDVERGNTVTAKSVEYRDIDDCIDLMGELGLLLTDSGKASVPNRWDSVSIGLGLGGHTAAIASNGTLWTWGSNDRGQLGNGTTTGRDLPARIDMKTSWASVSVGEAHTAAIRTDGSLWSWGWNSKGQLGDGTTTSRNVPAQVGTAKDWVMVSAGKENTAAIRKDGTLWVWGSSANGYLGNGGGREQHEPVRVGTATDWAYVSAGANHIAAIRKDRSLWAWGLNSKGQIGDGTATTRNVPTLIGDATNWASVSAGELHTVAVQTDGSLWSWGSNEHGQLGDGTTTNRNVPVKIGPLYTWTSASARGNHTVGTRTDGSLWSWGLNGSGQLGINTVDRKTSPEQIKEPKDNWRSVVAGQAHTAAIQADGSLWTWGNNQNGQLGDGTRLRRTVPAQIGDEQTQIGYALQRAGQNMTQINTRVREAEDAAKGANSSAMFAATELNEAKKNAEGVPSARGALQQAEIAARRLGNFLTQAETEYSKVKGIADDARKILDDARTAAGTIDAIREAETKLQRKLNEATNAVTAATTARSDAASALFTVRAATSNVIKERDAAQAAAEAAKNAARKNRYWSAGVAVGSSFSQPLLAAVPQITLAPFERSFFRFGYEFGFFGLDEGPGFSSMYPFGQFALFAPLGIRGGWFVGAGAGAYLNRGASAINFNEISEIVPTVEFTSGFLIGNLVEISYTLRTSGLSADFPFLEFLFPLDHRVSIGFVYRFFRAKGE